MTAQNKNNLFIRNIDSEQIHLRSEDNGDRFIEGYAIIWNQRSRLIRDWDGEYYEIIDEQALDLILNSPGLNVIATVDHDRSKMLARTKSGTLELIKDQRGLMYRIKVPDTTLGRDIAEMIKRGDYYESSFIFFADMENIIYDRSGKIPVRRVIRAKALKDVSIVIDATYANTAVKLRSKDWDADEVEPQQPENSKASLDILQKRIEIHKLNS